MTEIEVRVRQNGKPYLRVRLSESPATIGRDPEADVHLDSTAVSRVHARLFFDGAGIRIVDAGSTNGIKINGVQHARADIEPESTVTICDFAIRARRVVTAVEMSQELSEGWFDAEDEDGDRDTAARERAPSTFVGEHPEPSMPSVHLTSDDVIAEPSFRPDTDVETSAQDPYEQPRPDTREDGQVLEGSESAVVFVNDDEDADELDAERVPTDVPAIVSVMRNATADIETAKLTRAGVAVEVLVCVGARLHDVALVRVGDQYWWGDEPPFPLSLWVVPSLDRFPLVTHREPGVYDVQVPQDSTWKMFHRGESKAPTYRTGQLVGMRVEARETAEVSYGPYTIYLRCVTAPPPLSKRFDFKRLVPKPVVMSAFVAAALINFGVVAMPGKRPHFFISAVPEEEYIVRVDGVRPNTPPELPVPDIELPPPDEVARAQDIVKDKEEVVQSSVDEPVNQERPPIQIKRQKNSKPDPNAKITTIEAVTTPKQVSIGDFRVSGVSKGIAEPMIERGKAPPVVSGGTALLRGERPGTFTTSVIDKSGAGGNFAIIPPGRLEPGEIKQTVNAHGGDLTRCHSSNLDANGKLEMQWIVEEDGSVRNVRVVLDELRSPEMTKCVREAVSHWHFPTPKGGAATVSYPFRFKNENL
jgi:hypothetical protein